MNSELIKKNALTLTFLIFGFISFSQITYVSVSNGKWKDASTWGIGVPGNNDNVVINHLIELTKNKKINNVTINTGGYLHAKKKLDINNDCLILAGGEIYNSAKIRIKGNYHLDGIHSGTKEIRLDGFGTKISGVGGVVSNMHKFYIRNNSREIVSGSKIDFGPSTLYLRDGATVTNKGTVITQILRGRPSGETWVNDVNSSLFIDNIENSLELDASAPFNKVTYYNNNSTTTDIASTTGVYYDLNIIGDGSKQLTGDIEILNDLTLGGTAKLDANRSGSVSDIDIHGDWNNQGGYLNPSTGNVNFIGSNQSINVDPFGEFFYKLNFENSGTLLQNGNIDVLNNLSFSSTYNLNGNQVTIGKDFLNTGNFIANEGKVLLSNTSNQGISGSTTFYDLEIDNSSTVTINSGTSEIEGSLTLVNGTLVTNGELIIVSSEDKTARIAPVQSGTITGDVTVQRWYDPVFQGWHLIGAATKTATIQDWNDNFITTGFTGSNYPTFPFNNITAYDETVPGFKDFGITEVSNITDQVPIGSGRRVYMDNVQMMLDTKGEVHIGDFDFNISYTGGSGASNDGWNLISNPYASDIDWDGASWTKTNLNDAIYVWDSDLGLYNSYINGVSINGASNIIPSSQAFWVQTNSPNPQLIITENNKTSEAGTFKNMQDLQIFNLYVESNGSEDQIAIVVRDEATMNFDSQWDAYKFYTNTGIPNIASIAEDSTELSINSIPPFTEDIAIPIKVVAAPGTYNLKTYEDNILQNTSCATLEDLALGTFTPLTTNLIHSFDWIDTLMIEPRFLIHFTPPAQIALNNESCLEENDGTISVTGTGLGPWDYTWYDNQGNIIQQSMNDMDQDGLSNLSPGTYLVEIIGGNSCGNNTLEIEVLPASISSLELLSSSVDECNVMNNGYIEIDLQHDDPDMTWDLTLNDSNGILITLITAPVGVSIFSNLAADVYSVNAVNSCDDISIEANLIDTNTVISDFVVENALINLAANEQLVLNNTSTPADYYSWDFGDGSTSWDYSPTHSYNAIGTYEVVLTVGNNSCTNSKTMAVEVVDQVSSISEVQNELIEIYTDANHNILIETGNSIFKKLSIEIRNSEGKLIMKKNISKPEGTISIGRPTVASSYYFISGYSESKKLFSQKIKL